MSDKKFALAAKDIKTLVEGVGSCLATDRITVDGLPVGYMYREPPVEDDDSGWRFMAGDESDEYMDDGGNLGLFDVNTIANYDPEIVPLVFETIGSAFGRNEETGVFEAVESPVDPDECLHPDYPIVEGEHVLNEMWHITLPEKYNRRVEEGDLVLWRPGVTMYFAAWNNENDDTVALRLGFLKDEVSSEAFDTVESVRDGVTYHSYRIVEEEVESLHAFILSDRGHLQVAVYVDDIATIEAVRGVLSSIRLPDNNV